MKEIKELKPGDIVIYENEGKIELGIVKRKGHNDGEYFVFYHEGDTPALTDEKYLKVPLNNSKFSKMVEKHI